MKDFEDDGRTISDMSSTKQTPGYLSFSAISKRSSKKRSRNEQTSREDIQLTKEETRKFIFSAVLAGLAIGLVFIGVFFLFILFCVYIWFK